jgi:hypothetical protein
MPTNRRERLLVALAFFAAALYVLVMLATANDLI